MDDLIKRLTSYKTTIIGIVTAILAILVFFNIVPPENNGVEVVTTLWYGILQVLAGVSGVILVFSKDSDKE
mgnify:CR=1 FL=1